MTEESKTMIQDTSARLKKATEVLVTVIVHLIFYVLSRVVHWLTHLLDVSEGNGVGKW
jgi:hypothetical protein